MWVIKRDGRKEEWNSKKIEYAVSCAANEVGEDIDNISSLSDKILSKFQEQEEVPVASVHTAVENTLMASRYKKTARAYIEKRSQRDREREAGGKLFQDIDSFINQTSDEFIKENANKAATVVSTHRDLLAGIVSKHLAVTQILPKDVAEYHKAGRIHVHDLDYILSPLTNCLLVNYEDMLEHGFKIGDAQLEKPKSIGTACTILTQVSAAVASSCYGGQTAPTLDSGLKQYVEASYGKLKEQQRKWNLPDEWVDETIRKEVHDAMQTMLYQIQTLTTTNGQAAFQSITFGLDTSKFGRMITEEYLKVHMSGVGKDHLTPVFPKVIFFLEEGVNMNPGDPNYDLKQLAIKCSAERIYPDYCSVPKNREITGVKNAPISSMGCRSYLSAYRDEYGKEITAGRFNLGVVSLNLPFAALEAKRDNKDFYNVLDDYLEKAYSAHMCRVERLKGTKAKQNPIMWMEGAIARLEPEQTIDHLFYNGYASISIGYIGVSECCEILGNTSKEKAMKVLQFIKDKCAEFKLRSNIGFSVYGTPSESFCYKAANAVKKEFGENSIDHTYLTNSFHLPVWEQVTPWEKWGYEQGFAEISSGGNISYIEAPNLSNNLQAYEGLIDYAYHTGMHYYAINTPIDNCLACGFHGEMLATEGGYKCPCCGTEDPRQMSVIRRVSGYISSASMRPFNKGKKDESVQRVKHFKGKQWEPLRI